MRYKGTLLLTVLSLCSLFLFSEDARATAISDTSATLILDWGSLAVVWNEIDHYALNGADADLDGVTDRSGYPASGWGTDPAIMETAQVTADSVGIAETTFDSANATAHSRADGIGTTSPPDENVISSATSHRGRTFSPLADGLMIFSFEYFITQAFSTDFPSEVTSGYSKVDLHLSYQGTEIGLDEIIADNTGTDMSGRMGFEVDLLASNWYYLEGHVYSSASANSPEQAGTAVPEPSSMLLFGFGMIGLAGFRRTFRNQ